MKLKISTYCTTLLSGLALSGMMFPVIASSQNKREEKGPNLLFIFPDQFRVQAQGFVNEDPVFTPNIDRLAQQGIVFPNAVSNRPLSSPYRGMLLTGKYSFSNNLQTNCNTYSRKFGNYLREEEICFSDVLNQNGYQCGYIGKWHLDAPSYAEGPDVNDWREAVWEAYTPPGSNRHGFTFWHAYGCNNQHNDPYYWVNNASVQDTLFARKWSPEHEADVAIEFIHTKRKDPWALFVSMNPPHGPYQEVPARYRALYESMPVDSLLNRPNVPGGRKGEVGRKNVRDYFACVTGVDDQIGRILKALDESGQSENTIVIFTADHGEMMGSHGLLQKVVWYEESFRIPFIIRWPKKFRSGTNDLLLSVPDLMPTLLSLMGLEKHIPVDVEGRNYAEVFTGNSKEKPEFALYLNLESGYEDPGGGMRGLRTDHYTFVIQKNKQGGTANYLLYDNRNDPFQLKNIATEHPDLIVELEGKLWPELKRIKDPWTN